MLHDRVKRQEEYRDNGPYMASAAIVDVQTSTNLKQCMIIPVTGNVRPQSGADPSIGH